MGEKRQRQMPAVPAMSLFVSVSIMWVLCCGRSQLVLHPLFTASHWLRAGDLSPSSQRRERWKGRNVQLDQREGCMAKRSNVHYGCVRVQVFMCVSMKSALLCVLQRARCPDVWFTILCCRACGAYPFKSLMLTHTHSRTPARVLSLLHSVHWKMSRSISFPLLPVCCDSGKPVVAETLAGSLTWHRRAVLTRRITLLRTS